MAGTIEGETRYLISPAKGNLSESRWIKAEDLQGVLSGGLDRVLAMGFFLAGQAEEVPVLVAVSAQLGVAEQTVLMAEYSQIEHLFISEGPLVEPFAQAYMLQILSST